MRQYKKYRVLFALSFVISYIITLNEAYASHAEGADLTYKCLGGNQYELTVSFYRDCHGINAPASATVNCFSQSTNQNFNITLQPVPGTGQEISLVCSNLLTECQGGTYPGVQEWVYKITTTLSPATDWVFNFDLCCRNAAITTIVNPGGQNIHIESTLDNLNFPYNSSPVFSTKPIPFVCLNQNYTFNHGATDPDGDFITYELITPMNGTNSTVTYLPPYTATQPLTTNPAMGFDTVTGDVNMFPTMLEVSVMAVKVKQWRNNQLVGYVIRDIQLRTITCNNSYPYVDGINGTGVYMTNACAGTAITFNLYALDLDTNQTITLTWNNGIPNATFTVSGGQNPTGTFFWIPSYSDIGTHCFIITVTDNNCPINGVQTISICLVVYGVNVNVTTTSANCGASNGTAAATILGGTSPYTYLWLPCGCQNNPLNGLQAGTYTAIVTDGNGCTASDTGTVGIGAAPGNVTMNFTPASCFGVNDGSATANANGGQPPYTYLWSNGQTISTITGLSVGNYVVSVTTAQGCLKTDSITIIQPVQLSASVVQTDALCFGESSGSASVFPSGGTPPYTYQWNTGQTTQSVTGLLAGNYFVTVTDANNCSSIQSVQINQPTAVTMSIYSVNNATCFGGSNGSASVIAFGGIPPYTYMWNTNPMQTTQTATGLSSGNYIVSLLDSNGCTSLIACSITEPPAISSVTNFTDAKCFGSNTGSASINVSGGTAPYSYLWSNGLTTSSVTNLAAGNYSVMITDAYGCSHTDAVTISQPAILSAGISNVLNVTCNKMQDGSAIENGNGGTPPYSYQWSNGATTSQATNLASQTYSVTITDANGCTAIDTITITQPAAMAVTVSMDDTICPGQNTTISANATGGTNPFTYFWQPNVGFGNSQVVNPTSTTSYTVIVTDANGCTANGSATISVYNMNIAITATATPDICYGQTATVSASVSGNNIATYYWNNNLGNSAGPFTVSPVSTTTYSVTVTNVCGAADTAAVTVVVHPLPQINLSPQTAAGCDEVILQFSDTNSSNNGSAYSWNFGDGNFSTQTNPSHTYLQTGNYTVQVTVTSPYGCSFSAQTNCFIEIIPSPVADFTSDPPLETSIVNPDFRFFDASANVITWYWDFGDGNHSQLQNPHHSYAQTGIYTVKLVTLNYGGCIDSIIKSVEVKPEFTFYIPNTFTPNGDNTNDVFNGKGIEITEFEMLIFDRWGNNIFQSHDLNDGWDGRANGGTEIAQQDVYVYEIHLKDFSGKPHFYTGNVNLVK